MMLCTAAFSCKNVERLIVVVVRVADGRIGLFLISVREQASVDTLAQYEPPHDKTNKMTVRPAKTDQPGHPSAQSDQSLRCALSG